ncbi:MAG: hypothetical protein KF729_23380 [Sandaracinaceae bacterium]|nr:hypothetical protein [Sandaracinaceae bacterium]
MPFRVRPGAVLRLGDGARAVVLVGERPSRALGPRELDVFTSMPEDAVPAPWAAALLEILRRDLPRDLSPEEPLRAPRPSEDGLVRLVVGEGVPGASSTLGELEWQCDATVGCARAVELRASGTSERVLWRGHGERRVRYAGPDLERGQTYSLRVGERSYRVETLDPPPLLPLLRATAGWPAPEQMSVVAAVHLLYGSRAAASATLVRTRVEVQGLDPAAEALLRAYGL